MVIPRNNPWPGITGTQSPTARPTAEFAKGGPFNFKQGCLKLKQIRDLTYRDITIPPTFMQVIGQLVMISRSSIIKVHQVQ